MFCDELGTKHALDNIILLKRLIQKNIGNFLPPTVNNGLILTSLVVCDWSGYIFGGSARPKP